MNASALRLSLAALVLVGAMLVVPLGGQARSGSLKPVLTVTPGRSLFDSAIHVVVSGLPPGQQVLLRVRSRDAHGVAWSSATTYVADQVGTVDVDRSAPMSGSYSGVDPMGPFEALSPAGNYPEGLFYWWGSGSKPLSFSVSVAVGGQIVGSTQVERTAVASGETVTPEAVSARGFFGYFYQPPNGGVRHAAVLIFGGSEGGDSVTLTAGLLAAHGYPALALAYFKEPGLPQTLSSVPLEYFTRALTWLARQPDVNPKRIFVSGASRGSEAALLLGADFPALVYGVIANVPSNVAHGCWPCAGGPAWTLNGQPVPYSVGLYDLHPTDVPGAVIPVEKISGPIFLDCGGADRIWPSCPATEAIVARLSRFHRTGRAPVLSYADAGHGVGALVPYEPYVAEGNLALAGIAGSTQNANRLAVADLWPRLLAFLGRYG